MESTENYLNINKKLWDEKTPIHVDSDFYDVPGFLNGDNALKPIELELLGNVKGKKILHLQCHFGLDTLSLARMGADVTGVDFSEKSIEKAKELNKITGLDARFICCDVYTLPERLSEKFDIVFSSYGVIGWLPDMDLWSKVIYNFMKPKGKFVFVEFHPAVWMFDNDFKEIAFSYFNKEAIIETNKGTYANQNAAIETTEISWNHNLAEVLTSLLNCGLMLKDFQEYDYSPYPCFKGIIEMETGKFRLSNLEGKLPMVYSLVMEMAVSN
jgi:2-polyprenyl-3-methyl-5-hydroxy-6-metoxy-1,4-benzoquinol methylase